MLSFVRNHTENGTVVSCSGCAQQKVQATSAEKIAIVGVRCSSIAALCVAIVDLNFCCGRKNAVPERSASGCHVDVAGVVHITLLYHHEVRVAVPILVLLGAGVRRDLLVLGCNRTGGGGGAEFGQQTVRARKA